MRIVILLLLLTISLAAQNERLAIKYVIKYKDLAVAEMHRTGIPASIKLAQGLHESNYGTSRLAVIANNHFGIKCKSTWQGMAISHTDDAPDECFRKYVSSGDSYRDHSDFLTSRSRYNKCFYLELYDYRGWAKELKRAGYATDPRYTAKIIDLIERYSLQVYDKMQRYEPIEITRPVRVTYELVSLNKLSFEEELQYKKVNVALPPAKKSKKIGRIQPLKPNVNNGTKYVVYSQPVQAVQLSFVYDVTMTEIMTYNYKDGLNHTFPPRTKIYIEPIDNNRSKKYLLHSVKKGETMDMISLRYAISKKALMERNDLKSESIQVGQKLYLSGNKKHLRKKRKNRRVENAQKKIYSGVAKPRQRIPQVIPIMVKDVWELDLKPSFYYPNLPRVSTYSYFR